MKARSRARSGTTAGRSTAGPLLLAPPAPPRFMPGVYALPSAPACQGVCNLGRRRQGTFLFPSISAERVRACSRPCLHCLWTVGRQSRVLSPTFVEKNVPRP